MLKRWMRANGDLMCRPCEKVFSATLPKRELTPTMDGGMTTNVFKVRKIKTIKTAMAAGPLGSPGSNQSEKSFSHGGSSSPRPPTLPPLLLRASFDETPLNSDSRDDLPSEELEEEEEEALLK